MYLVKEVVDAIKRDLGLNDHRDLGERRPYLVSQQVKNCGHRSVL